MWPFTKIYPSISEFDAINSKWSIRQGVYQGSPIIVRKNDSVNKWLGHPDLSIKLSFAVPLNASNPNEMPDANENKELGKIEDIIESEVCKYFSGIFVMIITMGTFKEYVFYVKPGPDIGALHSRISSLVIGHEVQCSGAVDKNWDTYKSL